MKRYLAGEIAGKGSYYNPMTGRLIELTTAGRLPGGAGEKYLKVTGWMMMLIAPLATLLFIILLPVAYLATFATLWGYKLLRLMLGMGHAPIMRH